MPVNISEQSSVEDIRLNKDSSNSDLIRSGITILEEAPPSHPISASFEKEVLVFARYLSTVKTYCDSKEISLKNLELNAHHTQKLIAQNLESIFKIVHPKLIGHFRRVLVLLVTNIAFCEHTLTLNQRYKKYLRFYQKNLKHLFVVTDFIKQIHYKPLGYPGDFKIIDAIYQKTTTATGLYEQFIDHFTLNITLADSVRDRIQYIKHQINKDINIKKVLSVGSGSAEEIFEILGVWNKNTFEITLLDFEKRALRFATDRLDSVIHQHTVRPFLTDIVSLLKSNHKLEPQDLIYSLGLFDYLNDSLFVKLTKKLFGALESGGRLVIGNMAPEDPARAYMALIGEWTLLYRSREDLLTLAKKSIPTANAWVESNSNGAQLYLIIQKL